jgi:uncharacterized protein (TIGR03435 family)
MRALVIAALYLVPTLWGQHNAFEVASIKQDMNVTGHGGTCRGTDSPSTNTSGAGLGRCRLSLFSLRSLVSTAYGVKYEYVLGGPGWIDTNRYTVDAKADDALPLPTRAELLRMLQVLLEDRFQLQLHRETRSVSGYELVLGKDGTKLRKATTAVPKMPAFSSIGQLSGHLSVSLIADAVSANLHVPVIDATGLEGEYVVNLKWKPLEGEPGGTSAAALESQLPGLVNVLQSLGFELKQKQVVIDFLIIDSARPLTNE